ncbi:four-carbon acid sugar kinase family protein [Pokkaliibacter sp. MBI-7]|uniref:3-oxo-tetronate kinase n=1 Tax=Pokkaliibacter sp. MBI-7 TaxID=3040600 RepID=UPI0024485002|nr:3-oxo-tetronate kinase [Pokkaliibacter sp. MBI-7]MDH2436446.1 four-carbon acid sugar kinase family protein [Pokkaliibacter sp. MBI-7]
MITSQRSPIRLGVIADDFTGATDIAGFLVQNGVSTVQLSGIPDAPVTVDAQAIVISLKIRSCPATQAVDTALQAHEWLHKAGCNRFYFKYCSTFDSTAAGNIGPVTDALLDACQQPLAIICPSLPVNGRTVYQGHLFVFDQLLSESGMRHHPVTPMTDSHLGRVIEAQARGQAGLVSYDVIRHGSAVIAERLQELTEQGKRYAVMDTLQEQHLLDIAAAVIDQPLVTGGSGLAIGLARLMAAEDAAQNHAAEAEGRPAPSPSLILSGSCSEMTNRQVNHYLPLAAHRMIDIQRCLEDGPAYLLELQQWSTEQALQAYQQGQPAPLLYATATPDQVSATQQAYGAERASQAIETLFGQLAVGVYQQGVRNFIIAGGETSSSVTQALAVNAFHIGPQIAPGVPWVRATDRPLSMALKSGNFGSESFFSRAQEFLQ